MIIGDGDATRTDRLNLLNPLHTVTGIFSGTHSANGHQSCVILAQDFTPDSDDADATLTEPEYRTLDTDLFAAINNLRADPTSLVPVLQARISGYDGLIYKAVGKLNETTAEGVAAVNEAIAYLQNTASVTPALTIYSGMTSACSDHVTDTTSGGEIGSTGADGSSPTERVNRYGISSNVGGGGFE
jgi:uncharacterized protein YkwD